MTHAVSRLFSLGLLVAFALYTIPTCQCAAMMKAKDAPSCCASASQDACDAQSGCCADGVNAEKMKTEKSFESASASTPQPALLTTMAFPEVSASSSPSVSFNAPCALSPPSLSFLQVFRI